MFTPRTEYPTGESESDRFAFLDGLSQANALCAGAPVLPHIIAGAEIQAFDGATYASVDPNEPTRVLAHFPVHNIFASRFEAQRLETSIGLIRRAQTRWQSVPWQDRVKVVRALTRIVEEKLWLLVGLMALEGGKRPFPNGIGEIMEAIDFCENAIAQAERLYTERSPRAPDFMCDFNAWLYMPKGIIVDIEPFNFALAIPMEKIVSSIVTGNAIIMKASGHTPLQGYTLYRMVQQAFDEVGLQNDGIVNFISDSGGDLASFLLQHPLVDGFTFTGSHAAYSDILEKTAGLVKKSGGRLQEIAAETSGCNAMIVASDANVDKAVIAARDSLINNSGQTCSHLGHLVLDTQIADEFMLKFREALDVLKYGDVKDLQNHCGPVITATAAKRCVETIARLEKLGWVETVYVKDIEQRNPSDFAPRILLVRPNIKSQTKATNVLRSTEVFGMAVMVWVVDTRTEAKTVFESGDFGLTGGLFTNDAFYASQFALEYRGAAQKYVNTRITGATVGMAFGGLASSASSGDGTGAGTLQALSKYVSHVNAAVCLPSPETENAWREAFSKGMPLTP